jgi:hypothetical protein
MTNTVMNPRKAALRSNPDWLNALDLGADAPSENAAVMWSARLNAAGVPDTLDGVRILAARRALTYTPYVSTDTAVQRYHDAHAIVNPRWPRAPHRMTPFREACRNAAVLVAVLVALWGALHLI